MSELKEMGYQIVLRPVSALLSISATLQKSYGSLIENGTLSKDATHLSFNEYNEMIGLQDYN